jgi:hypothetical protein
LRLDPGTLTLLLIKTTDTWQGVAGPNTMAEPAVFALRTLDLQPPEFTLRRPLIQRVYYTSVRADFALSEPGRVAFIVLLSTLDVQPSSVLVFAGSIRPEYQADAAAAGSVLVPRANTAVTANITGLQGLTDYDLWAVGVDEYGNQMPLPTRLKFSTLDNEPPEVLSLAVEDVLTHSTNFTVTLDEPGRAHYVVERLPKGSSDGAAVCPSAAALKASGATLAVRGANAPAVGCVARVAHVS